ncbi:MAG: hypothetical protein MJB57_17865 [Gemmatimonadetes bacterium]|nr:hypothetical protein [Gemmatimonadota bacterium]
MNWDALGAIAEAVGAAAVVISMLVLAYQIRDSNRVAKAEAIRARGERMVDVWWRVAENERLSSIVSHAFFREEPLETLPEEERDVFHAVARSLMLMWESEYLENRHGALDDDVWERRVNSIASMTLKPAYGTVWAEVRPILTGEFVRQVDGARERLGASTTPALAERSDSGGADSPDRTSP